MIFFFRRNPVAEGGERVSLADESGWTRTFSSIQMGKTGRLCSKGHGALTHQKEGGLVTGVCLRTSRDVRRHFFYYISRLGARSALLEMTLQ